MKNIQVIDGANNCTYDIFAAMDKEFDIIFPSGTDIEFAEDFFSRVGEKKAAEITKKLWTRPIQKKKVQGIHGTLFYQLQNKKKYYPDKTEKGMVALGVDK